MRRRRLLTLAIFVALVVALGVAGVLFALCAEQGPPSQAPPETSTPGQTREQSPDPCADRSLAAEVVPASVVSATELFTQKDPRWSASIYARADEPADACGTTIAQCGCALTSAVNVLRIFGHSTMPDGRPLTPATVNEYFNRDARPAGTGWVSKGYYHNGVNWFTINELSAEITRANPGTRRIVFVPPWGPGSVEEISNEVGQGRPVILELYLTGPRYTGPHFVTATGIVDGRVVVKDPAYSDLQYLDPYLPYIQSSRLFRYADEGPVRGGVHFSVSRTDSVRIVDSDGNVVATFEGSTADEAIERARKALPNAVITYQPAWRDASCSKVGAADDEGRWEWFIPDDGRVLTVVPEGASCVVALTRVTTDGLVARDFVENPENADCAAPPRRHTLTLEVMGTGSGAVVGAGTYDTGATVPVAATAAPGSTFAGWSGKDATECRGGTVVMTGDKACTATFEKPPPGQYTLALSTAGVGSGAVVGAGAYDAGAAVPVSATAAPGSTFAGWSGNDAAECRGGVVVMSANKSCIAVFNPVLRYVLVLNTAGAGTGTVSGAGTYDAGTAVSVSATAAAGSTFVEWSGINAAECAAGLVVMDADKTCTADFALAPSGLRYTLALTVNPASTGGGTVSGGGTYPAGTAVPVSATPLAGSYFRGWFGPDEAECASGQVVMNADKSCSAIFHIPGPDRVDILCSKLAGNAFRCDVSVAGAYTTVAWSIDGEPLAGTSGATSITRAIPPGPAGTTFIVEVDVCNVVGEFMNCSATVSYALLR